MCHNRSKGWFNAILSKASGLKRGRRFNAGWACKNTENAQDDIHKLRARQARAAVWADNKAGEILQRINRLHSGNKQQHTDKKIGTEWFKQKSSGVCFIL